MDNILAMDIQVRRIKNSPVIQCWQISCKEDAYTEHTVMPSPFTQVIFPMTEAIDIEQVDKPLSVPFVSPILGCFKKIKVYSGSVIFGMHLDPLKASALYAHSPVDLVRNANPISEVFKKNLYRSLKDIIYKAKDFAERVQATLKFFDQLSDRKNIIYKGTLNAVLESIKENTTSSIHQVSRDLGYSERWIQKIHKEIMGVTPTEQQRIIRFNRLLNKLYAPGDLKITQLAIDSGYYDQAHATREFKKLGDKTPNQFLNEQPVLNRIMNYYA